MDWLRGRVLQYLLDTDIKLGLEISVLGTLHDFTKPIQRQQRLAPLLWSLIKIIMKSQEEESKTPEAHFLNILGTR